jgi:hypothetical protein
MLTNNKKDVTVKVNDIKSIKSIQKKINENDKITFIITKNIIEVIVDLQKDYSDKNFQLVISSNYEKLHKMTNKEL